MEYVLLYALIGLIVMLWERPSVWKFCVNDHNPTDRLTPVSYYYAIIGMVFILWPAVIACKLMDRFAPR